MSNAKRGIQPETQKGGWKITFHRWMKRAIPWILAGCLLVIAGAGAGFLWWRNQPPQVFPFWLEDPTNASESNGVTLDILVARNEDGSGTVKYTFSNDTTVKKTWNVGAWLDYYYNEKFYGITGPYSVPLGKNLYFLSPGESFSKVLELPPRTLSKPGRYRFFARDVGCKDFVLSNDGTIVVEE